MWFNKKHPQTLYIDLEPREKGVIACRPEFEAKPDLIADFRALPFPDKSFKHIVWDPPQLLNLGQTSIMRKKYGSLKTETWRYDLGKGFEELWRVLDDNGTLIFKWNEADIPLKDVLHLFKQQPLYGHPTAKHGKTIWVAFFKEVQDATTN